MLTASTNNPIIMLLGLMTTSIMTDLEYKKDQKRKKSEMKN